MGLLPRLEGPWRWLSHQAYFDLMWAVFGTQASPYHVVSLVVHAACASLLFVFLRRWVSLPAALVGAVFFAAHPSLYTAVYWTSAIGDSLALLFALAVLLLVESPGWARFLAVPAFALSLAAKESTILLPLYVAIANVLPWDRPTNVPASRRKLRLDTVVLLLLAESLLFGLWLLLSGRSGTPAELTAGAPYAVGIGSHLWQNLLSYLGWSANFLIMTVTGFTDAIDPPVYPWGVGLLVLWLVGLRSSHLRRSGWAQSGLLFLLLLLPVLPLRNHTYHYYLYAPLMGVAWLVSAVFDLACVRVLAIRSVRAPRGTKRPSPSEKKFPDTSAAPARVVATTAALVGLLGINGYSLVRKIETAPFSIPGLRSDPTVDRALVAERVAAGIRRADLPPGTSLWLWSPARMVPGTDPNAPETYWERNVRVALLDGLAVRVLFPRVPQVDFVRDLTPPPAGYLYAVFGVDGRTDIFTWSALDSAIRSGAAREG